MKYFERRRLLKDAREGAKTGDISMAYSYLNKFGIENNVKINKEMAEIISKNWKLNENNPSLKKVTNIAKKNSTLDILVDNVKEIISSGKVEVAYDKIAQYDTAKAVEMVFDVTNFVYNYCRLKQYDDLYNRVIYKNLSKNSDMIVAYTKFLKEAQLYIREEDYDQIINCVDFDDVFESVVRNCPRVAHWEQVVQAKTRIIKNELIQEKDNQPMLLKRLDNLVLSGLRCNLFEREGINPLIQIALETTGLRKSATYILENKDLSQYKNINPKMLENCVLNNKLYHFARKVAKIKGVDSKKIAQMVLDGGDFWNNYYFAREIPNADKQAHLDVMLKQIPSVKMQHISDSKAEYNVSRSQDLEFKLYGVIPERTISDRNIEQQRNIMRKQAVKKYQDEAESIKKAIRVLSQELNLEKTIQTEKNTNEKQM